MQPRLLFAGYAAVVLTLSLAHTRVAGQEPAMPVAAQNPNTVSTGTYSAGRLAIQMVARQVRWHPEADDGPSLTVEAFGEEGGVPTIPGPLIRAPAGTRIESTIRNALPDTLLVFGLSGSGGTDTLRIAPGASGRGHMTLATPGTYAYGAATIVGDSLHLLGTGNQLLGAVVIDGISPRPDRVFVISIWPTVPGRFVMAINGKSWPHTERLDLVVGDSVHWRVINGTRGRHPMHLHGFYFRIDSRGSWFVDTAVTAGHPHVVTESIPYRSTFTMTWTAQRAGNWLFHCHDALHISWRRRYNLRGERPPPVMPVHDGPHVEQDMSGLVLGIRARDRVQTNPQPDPVTTAHAAPGGRTTAARQLRLTMNEKADHYGREPGFSYIASTSATAPRDSLEIPARPLLLMQDEPVAITLVNQLSIPTAVHWHGIELESYYDGVGGWSGNDVIKAPVIAPGDSFVVRMTPPRAGTFIFHAHVDDMRQIALGLYGALIVLPPRTEWQPATDHIFVVSQLGRGPQATNGLNGSRTPVALALKPGRHRLRFINISIEDDANFSLLSAGQPVSWRLVAKDGADRPDNLPHTNPLYITPGETYDFEVTLAAGDYTLTMDSRADATLVIHVR